MQTVGKRRLIRFDGQGEYIWANGNSFLGEFKVGNPNGYGVWKKQQKKADGEVHEGYFSNGKKDGLGITKFANGNFYRGYYYKNKRQGYGEMNWVDRRVSYRGEWVDGKQTGIGILEFENEVTPYFGLFKEGIMMEIYDMEDKQAALDKLANLKRAMEEEIEKFKGESAKRGNISRILGETINSIYDKKLYDFGGKRKKGAALTNRGGPPTRDGHVDRREDSMMEPRGVQYSHQGPLNQDLSRSNNPSNPRLQAGRFGIGSQAQGRKIPSAGLSTRAADRLPGIRDRPSEEDRSFQYHSFAEDSQNPRRDRGQSNRAKPRDRSANINNQYRSIDGRADKPNGGKPFQFYKGRTTYLDRLITDKLKLHQAGSKKTRPILIKEGRGQKPVWKPSGIKVDGLNMGNLLL